MKLNKKYMINEELLTENGWTVICESPFEIQHENGSFATMDAAYLILSTLKSKKKTTRVKKSYKLKVNYMIGDADGHTDTTAVISVNNPFLQIITDALDKLKVCKGSWGIQLSNEDYTNNYNDKNINKLEYDLLCLVSNYQIEEDSVTDFCKEHNFGDIVSEETYEYLLEFDGLFIEDTEYSFLVYRGYKFK